MIGAAAGSCRVAIGGAPHVDEAVEALVREAGGLARPGEGYVEILEPLCSAVSRLRPSQVLRLLDARGLADMLRGMLDFRGHILDPEPSAAARNWVIHIEVPDRRWGMAARLAMRFFAVNSVVTSDETGARAFVVVFEDESVARLIKTVRPIAWRPWEDPAMSVKWRLYEGIGDPICQLK